MFVPVAYASIDWHDFVVVETVDFQPNETGEFLFWKALFMFDPMLPTALILLTEFQFLNSFSLYGHDSKL